MEGKLKIYQINLHKCEGAQSNLMVELANIKEEHFLCLIQEPHFSGKNPSYIDRRFMQTFHGKGTRKKWPRAMIVASKNLKISMIESLTSRDNTCITLHNANEELIICSS